MGRTLLQHQWMHPLHPLHPPTAAHHAGRTPFLCSHMVVCRKLRWDAGVLGCSLGGRQVRTSASPAPGLVETLHLAPCAPHNRLERTQLNPVQSSPVHTSVPQCCCCRTAPTLAFQGADSVEGRVLASQPARPRKVHTHTESQSTEHGAHRGNTRQPGTGRPCANPVGPPALSSTQSLWSLSFPPSRSHRRIWVLATHRMRQELAGIHKAGALSGPAVRA